MTEYDETKQVVVSQKVVTFSKICFFLTETIGSVIGAAAVALILLWALLQVIKAFTALILGV